MPNYLQNTSKYQKFSFSAPSEVQKTAVNSVQGLTGCYSTEKVYTWTIGVCVDSVGCSDEFVWSPAVCLPEMPKIHQVSAGGQDFTLTVMAPCLREARVAHLNLIFSTERGLRGNQAPQDRRPESPSASQHIVQPSPESPVQGGLGKKK